MPALLPRLRRGRRPACVLGLASRQLAARPRPLAARRRAGPLRARAAHPPVPPDRPLLPHRSRRWAGAGRCARRGAGDGGLAGRVRNCSRSPRSSWRRCWAGSSSTTPTAPRSVRPTTCSRTTPSPRTGWRRGRCRPRPSTGDTPTSSSSCARSSPSCSSPSSSSSPTRNSSASSPTPRRSGRCSCRRSARASWRCVLLGWPLMIRLVLSLEAAAAGPAARPAHGGVGAAGVPL